MEISRERLCKQSRPQATYSSSVSYASPCQFPQKITEYLNENLRASLKVRNRHLSQSNTEKVRTYGSSSRVLTKAYYSPNVNECSSVIP